MRVVLRELKAYVAFMIKGIKYKWYDIWKNMVIGWCQNLERMADVLG
jgi:phosphatidylglycerophosphatase A